MIINATPVGMGNGRQSPLEEKELNAQYVFDLVYAPAETKLIRMAREKNLHVIPGLEMFVQQGARQFEIWTGKPAPVAEMAYVVTKALERRLTEEPTEETAKSSEGNNSHPPHKAASATPSKPAIAPRKVVAKGVVPKKPAAKKAAPKKVAKKAVAKASKR